MPIERAEPADIALMIERGGDGSIKLSEEGTDTTHYQGYPVSDRFRARLKALSLQELGARRGEVEKALLKSQLGLTPNNDGKVVRLRIPALTEERRKSLVKVARDAGERAKNEVRQIRRDGNDIFKKMEKSKEISEDQMHDGQEEIQRLTDAYVGKVGSVIEAKEKEILEF